MNYTMEIVMKIAENPCTPPDILRKMVSERWKDNYISEIVANNHNCPPDALKMVLERGKDDRVSWYAAQNPNCPILAKIKWMRATGKIGKEDPNDPKQFIEYDNEPKVDTDLQKLRELAMQN